jgi:hypothetical protein
MSSFSNVDTLITQQPRGSPFAIRDFKYRVRIATAPDIVIVCDTSAGIQTARLGGTTHVPSRVRIVITPRDA